MSNSAAGPRVTSVALSRRLALWPALIVAVCSAQSPREKNAIALLERGRVDQAEQILLEALKDEPRSESVNALLGQIAFSRQNYSQAISRFQKAGAFLANNPLLQVNYAEALLQSKTVDAAKRILNTLPAQDSVAQFEAGLLLARFGQFAPAEDHFRLAKPGYPQPQVLAYNLALAQYNAGKFAESAATLEELRKGASVDADAVNLLGQAYAEAGEHQKAAAVLQEATKSYPRDERNYLALAKLAIDTDATAMGLEAVDRGLKYLPDSYALLIQRGYLRLAQGMYKEAEADYRRATELQPDSASPKIGLAFILLQNQRQGEAASLLEQVLASHPNFFVQYLMGELCIREGREDDALGHLRKSAELEPNFSPAHTNLGKIYLKKNDAASAIRELELAVRIDPEDVSAFYQLSMAYRRNGEREKAQAALAHVRELNKDKRELGTTLFITRRLRKLRTAELSPF